MGRQLLSSDVMRNAQEVHRDALVRALKKASQSVWDRQAFVARVREVVPFV
jgi:hypothetical protein